MFSKYDSNRDMYPDLCQQQGTTNTGQFRGCAASGARSPSEKLPKSINYYVSLNSFSIRILWGSKQEC